jgi:uncharacterized membrane protein
MMWEYGHGAGSEGWLMLMFMIVFVVATVIAVVYLVRYLSHPQAPQTQMQTLPSQQAVPAPPPPAPATETPQDIVKRRYAAGEIDRDEYLQKLGDL